MPNLALADEVAGAGADLAERGLARLNIAGLLELPTRLDKEEKVRIRSIPAAKSSEICRGTGAAGTDEGDEVVGLVVAEEVRVEEHPAERSKRAA
jgi:hypothetical protein